MNIKSEFKPLYIYEPGTLIIPYGGGEIERSPFSKFPVWNHWPVAQIPSDGRNALALDRVSSSAILSPEPPMTKRASDGAVEGRFLMGLTNQPIAAALPIARSWLRAPELTSSSKQFASDGYSRDDRAYHLRRQLSGEETLQVSIAASENHPAINPAFVIDGWGPNNAALKINGKPVAIGKDLRVGHIDHLDGTSLVVWVRGRFAEPFRITVNSVNAR